MNDLLLVALIVTPYLILIVFTIRLYRALAKELEARRKLEEVDDLKNQFITVSSHYLRTPLTIIKNAINQIKTPNYLIQTPKQIGEIETNVTELDNLIEKFLLISTIEKGQVKITPYPSNLNLTIKGVVSDYETKAKEQSIRLEFREFYLFPKFPFDPVRIKEVVASLIDNAIKFNIPGGFVMVSLKNNPSSAVIEIQNSGPGIPKEHLDTLFTKFNRGSMAETLQFDKPGAGLSLYLAKLIIDSHHGKITVESTAGQTTTFTVYLPIANLSQDR